MFGKEAQDSCSFQLRVEPIVEQIVEQTLLQQALIIPQGSRVHGTHSLKNIVKIQRGGNRFYEPYL